MDIEDSIFNNDSIFMRSLLGKKVQINTVNEKSYIGVVYVIDPIFKTVVLHTDWKSANEHETVIILHHAIKSLEKLSDEVEESYLLEPIISVPQSVNKKTVVKKWLKKMMIDVKESGDYLKIDDHLLIVPPYGPENCICNNTIILEKIQKILQSLPEIKV
ncbi:gem-associated protein 6-like [Diorhabda carinulata]|uniref:gem-associated protein 6-like n=1 Tax=Diorhabda sublineata TaxID=1163346 RepID=UPI0024E0718E|nr:gem-associated protein 6-like [Diorhabda sublineata]XP_056634062.1 gem-associated protein 6-like [Diorhabda sublineata]XP_056634063.1 gem-associated protein 6-like [Diorhabda sublineata]XP_056634065.1 gem-associated protein 6-like [Diorhabda sublineata]XP_056634066.1 gem-associated protein 6-like [Diorhabda sublineata]XP_057664415.1 gem-associated protein 6-like [Diorhabda carinulata]